MIPLRPQPATLASPGLQPPLRRELLASDALTLLITIALLGLIARVAYVQTQMGDLLAAKALRQQRMVQPIPPRRGLVLDAAGRVLAGSVNAHSVFVDPTAAGAERLPEIATGLSGALGLKPDELLKKLQDKQQTQFVWVARRLEPDLAQAVEALELPGVGVIKEPRRTYPMGQLAAHVIGHCGVDEVGLEGLERSLNDLLVGVAGRQEVLCDARRRPLQTLDDTIIPPRDGHSVMLTLDAVIQDSAERHLKAAIDQFQAKSGVAIAMDPKTGEILAIANHPTYDPNHYAISTAESRRNRALTDPFEPGSVFKTVIAAAAVDRGFIKLTDKLHCENGAWRIGRRTLNDAHPYGVLDFRTVVVKSSNIGMAKVGMKMTNPVLYDVLASFGFADRTGLDLPGEDKGLLPPLKRWKSYTTPSISMGHEAAVTPLQMLTAFSAILNEGQLMRPRIIRGVFDSAGAVVADHSQPVRVRQVLKPEVARAFTQDVMAGVVNEGTGKRAQLLRYQVVGKSGTAQIPRFGGRGYEPDAYVSSFLGAAPASDPRVAVLVSVVRPVKRLGYYGGTVSGPAVRDILADSLAYLGVPAERTEEEGLAVNDPAKAARLAAARARAE